MKLSKNVLILYIFILLVGLSLIFCLIRVLLRPQAVAQAKVAIVIDDLGYNLRYLNLFRQIDVPITLSILPNLRYSSKMLEFAQSQGKEVILHLPLEPEPQQAKLGWEKDTITSDLSEIEIQQKLKRAFSSLPQIHGVSNHMGSRLTQESRPMSIIFSELKKRKLFFLDNLVTDKSICKKLAQQMKVKYIRRDFFLDNSSDYEYIKKQFKKLTEFAQEHGRAVGVGHAKYNTLKVLKEELDSMQKNGIEFVFISELVK